MPQRLEISYFWSAVDACSSAVLRSVHHPLPYLHLCFKHWFSHPSLNLLHSLFDTPHRRYFMCTCAYPDVADQRCVPHIKLSHLSSERRTCLRLWLAASDNITASHVFPASPTCFPPSDVKICLRKSFHAVPADSVIKANLDKLFSEAAHLGEFSSPLSREWCKEENYIITGYQRLQPMRSAYKPISFLTSRLFTAGSGYEMVHVCGRSTFTLHLHIKGQVVTTDLSKVPS